MNRLLITIFLGCLVLNANAKQTLYMKIYDSDSNCFDETNSDNYKLKYDVKCYTTNDCVRRIIKSKEFKNSSLVYHNKSIYLKDLDIFALSDKCVIHDDLFFTYNFEIKYNDYNRLIATSIFIFTMVVLLFFIGAFIYYTNSYNSENRITYKRFRGFKYNTFVVNP